MTDIPNVASNKFLLLGIIYIIVFIGFLSLAVVQEPDWALAGGYA